jgi:hypothetical protein
MSPPSSKENPLHSQAFTRIGGDLNSGKTLIHGAQRCVCVQRALCGLHVVQRDGFGPAGKLLVRRIVGVQAIASRLPRAVACSGSERFRVYLASAIRPGAGDHAEHRRGSNGPQGRGRCVFRVQEKPRAPSGARFRARENRGHNENGRHVESPSATQPRPPLQQVCKARSHSSAAPRERGRTLHWARIFHPAGERSAQRPVAPGADRPEKEIAAVCTWRCTSGFE